MDAHRDRGGLEAGGRNRLRHELRWAVHDGREVERKGQDHRLHRHVCTAFGRTAVDGWRSCLLPEEGSLPVEGRRPETDADEAQGLLRRGGRPLQRRLDEGVARKTDQSLKRRYRTIASPFSIDARMP